MQSTGIPAWAGILSFIVGLAIVVGMAKWVARRERTRGPDQDGK